MSDGVSGIEGVDSVKLADISQPSHDEYVKRREVSHALEGAILKAVSFPSHRENIIDRSNTLLSSKSENTFLDERVQSRKVSPLQGDTTNSLDPHMEQVIQNYRDLYVDMTNFSVAWSVAKRTGRDIETLLRAQ
ncbi:hypothetical protein [uncultured Roseobacter sp.]|uniref:hypothetical protein n=1 Tax=uncultured Roseobacter sp. TaxID=114847 RepID=UPI002606BB74|nr:hypothetical protein [uncultured Roseobacter sp.]